MSIEQCRSVADWVAAGGKDLTTVSHHPRSRRPLVRPWRHSRAVSEGSSRRHDGRGRAHAETGVAEGILAILGVACSRADATGRARCRALSAARFELEGHELIAVEVGHTNALQSRAVVAGRKRAARPDDPTVIEETRAYICDFDRIAGETSTAEELHEGMLAAYPKSGQSGRTLEFSQSVERRDRYEANHRADIAAP